MKISKAVITAAGPRQRRLPLQRFVDLDGSEKTALKIIIEELVAANVEQIAVVVRHGDDEAYTEAADEYAPMLTFVEQPMSRGYGDALFRAAGFVGDDPFFHLVSDHLYISGESRRCAQQLVDIATSRDCAVSAVQATRESMLPYYGTVGGRPAKGCRTLYEIETVMEKPTPTEAEQHLLVPGLRAGRYLCLFGMHVLTPTVMSILQQRVEASNGESVLLSPALAALAECEQYLATELHGTRHDIGVKYGLLLTQLALALNGAERDNVLASLVELLATRNNND